MPFEYVFVDLWFVFLLFLSFVPAKILGKLLRNPPNFTLAMYVVFNFGLTLYYGTNVLNPSLYNRGSFILFGWDRVEYDNTASFLHYIVLYFVALADIVYLFVAFFVFKSKLPTASQKQTRNDARAIFFYNSKLFLIFSVVDCGVIFVLSIFKEIFVESRSIVLMDWSILGMTIFAYCCFLIVFWIVTLMNFKQSLLNAFYFVPIVFSVLGFILVLIPWLDFVMGSLQYLVLSFVNIFCIFLSIKINRTKSKSKLGDVFD